MCIAICKKPGVRMKDAHLEESFSSHPHGSGYAYTKDGEVVIVKGLMTIDEFKAAYRKDEEANPESVFIIHFRTSTSGTKTPENTHPFPGKECAVIHNGVFFSPSGDKSDTNVLITAAADRLTKHAVTTGLAAISKHIGTWNKMVFLFKDNTYAIANEAGGVWDEGVWYSNRSYLSFGYSRRPSSGSFGRGYSGREG